MIEVTANSIDEKLVSAITCPQFMGKYGGVALSDTTWRLNNQDEDSTLVSAYAAGTPPPVTPHRPGTVPQHTIQICGYSGRRSNDRCLVRRIFLYTLARVFGGVNGFTSVPPRLLMGLPGRKLRSSGQDPFELAYMEVHIMSDFDLRGILGVSTQKDYPPPGNPGSEIFIFLFCSLQATSMKQPIRDICFQWKHGPRLNIKWVWSSCSKARVIDFSMSKGESAVISNCNLFDVLVNMILQKDLCDFQKPKADLESIKRALSQLVAELGFNTTRASSRLSYQQRSAVQRTPSDSNLSEEPFNMDRYPCVNRYKHGVDCPDCVVVSQAGITVNSESVESFTPSGTLQRRRDISGIEPQKRPKSLPPPNAVAEPMERTKRSALDRTGFWPIWIFRGNFGIDRIASNKRSFSWMFPGSTGLMQMSNMRYTQYRPCTDKAVPKDWYRLKLLLTARSSRPATRHAVATTRKGHADRDRGPGPTINYSNTAKTANAMGPGSRVSGVLESDVVYQRIPLRLERKTAISALRMGNQIASETTTNVLGSRRRIPSHAGKLAEPGCRFRLPIRAEAGTGFDKFVRLELSWTAEARGMKQSSCRWDMLNRQDVIGDGRPVNEPVKLHGMRKMIRGCWCRLPDAGMEDDSEPIRVFGVGQNAIRRQGYIGTEGTIVLNPYPFGKLAISLAAFHCYANVSVSVSLADVELKIGDIKGQMYSPAYHRPSKSGNPI
ncbi:hypothetical protein CCUS01_16462 [Colletotrichum cuscutae]|uniref:Uncharacterized protein n=1 Tax=Colletotrichum cuscutae TaxID=1209917 RepID=A0AAI9VD73_9PEZI|nr:hypothetical protein CCUS01_16462 [Colletotrichum cuscutae]